MANFLKGTGPAALAVGLLSLAFSLPMSCTTIEPSSTTFFESNIEPILATSCTRSPTGSGCHVADAHGNALGNLDASSYASITKRRDLLDTYGPYGQPSLLIKNIKPFTIEIQAYDGLNATFGESTSQPLTVTTAINHVGGPILDPTQSAFQTIKQWINNGATEDNTGVLPNTLDHYPCVSIDPDMSVAPFNASTFVPGSINRNAPDYVTFKNTVATEIHNVCASANCHGTSSNELYFLCGSDPAQLDWNYFSASQYVSNPPQASELIRRPLAPAAGGSFHEGGAIFQTASDPNYQAFETWAKQHGPTDFSAIATKYPLLPFFAHRIQPVLAKKGCMMLQCHSAAMAHDYRLRGGSGGSFSYPATLKNYQLSLAQLALDSPTVDPSRLVRKNLFRLELVATPLTTPLENVNADSGVDAGDAGGTSPDAGVPAADGAVADAGGASGAPSTSQPLGMYHRGGGLLEDFGNAGPSSAACDGPGYNYDTDSLDNIPAYCMMREWHRRELLARNLAPLSAIVYVKRPIPAAPDRTQDWDLFAGNAELHIVAATLDAANNVTLGADTTVDLTTCGLAAGADVRRPAVKWDGTAVAFAGRSTSSDAFAIYEMSPTGTGCTKHALNNVAPPAPSSGCTTLSNPLIHNFDPAYGPDGRIVFASTRGNLALAQGNVNYCGPQNTPADPSKLNSNLYSFDPSDGTLTQLTFLLNMERHPNFMGDGRIIMTTEKRAPGFYQLALRRQNLDTGDYHPLYAQRESIGYNQVDQVVELSDKNFAAIFSQMGSQYHGGLLGVFNRSIGVDFTSTNPAAYPIDPTVLNPSSLTSIEPAFFIHSLRVPDSAATGTPGNSGNIYTTPSPIPGGKMLVSLSSAQADPGTFTGGYDLVALDPETGTSAMLVPGGGSQVIEAVGVYARPVRGPDLPAAFVSASDEPNGRTQVTPGTPTVDLTMNDFPVLATLLFQNTPTGRDFDPGVNSVDIYEDLPPTPDVTSLTSGSQYITTDSIGPLYVRRRLIGSTQLLSDGSFHAELPGGVPFVLHLPNTPLSMQHNYPRWQREEMEFAPGEQVFQSLSRTFFNNICGQCHGSISGQQVDVAVDPDVLTQASALVSARTAPATSLGLSPGSRSSSIIGAPTTP
jgi:hypothetical protein